MAHVTLYTRVECHLCEIAREVLDTVRARHAFTLEVVDIDRDASLRARYGNEVPVITIDGRKAFKYRVDPSELRRRLERADAGAPLAAIDDEREGGAG
jgi:glutaredoxin